VTASATAIVEWCGFASAWESKTEPFIIPSWGKDTCRTVILRERNRAGGKETYLHPPYHLSTDLLMRSNFCSCVYVHNLRVDVSCTELISLSLSPTQTQYHYLAVWQVLTVSGANRDGLLQSTITPQKVHCDLAVRMKYLRSPNDPSDNIQNFR